MVGQEMPQAPQETQGSREQRVRGNPSLRKEAESHLNAEIKHLYLRTYSYFFTGYLHKDKDH